MKTETVKVRLEETDKEQLAEISNILDVPISQIIREGLRERIAELKRTHPLLQEADTLTLVPEMTTVKLTNMRMGKASEEEALAK